MKGEVKKRDKKLAEQPARFPMRTLEISEGDFLRYNQEFFEMYDFILLMFVACILMFIIMSTLQVVPNEKLQSYLNSNLTYYIALLVFSIICQNLSKNTFNLGYFKFTDETKMEMFMALKAFILTYSVFKQFGSQSIFDYDLVKIHNIFNNRLNEAFGPFSIPPKQLPVDYTYFVFGLFAALLSFVVVRVQIKFAHFFYVVTNQHQKYKTDAEDGDNQLEQVNKKMNKILKGFLYVNFLFPLVIVLLYINPLTKSLLVPNLISDQTFIIIRVIVVLIACAVRCLSFREELQFQFNESYTLI